MGESPGRDLNAPGNVESHPGRGLIGNALIALMKKKLLNAGEVVQAFEISQRIAVRLTPVGISEALRVATRFNIYAYDAYYLQCCIEKRLPLISLDSRLCIVARDLNIDVVAILRKMRAVVESYRVEVRVIRNATPPQFIRSVHMLISIKGKNLSDNKMKRAISLSKEKYCSVFHSLRKDLDHTVEYEIV